MPVIGRLDKQVEELLINPTSKKRDDDSAKKGPPAQAPPLEESDESTALDETVAQRDELPVWLL